MRRLTTTLLLFPIIVFLLNGCTESLEEGLPGSASNSSTYHSTGWKDNPQHGSDYSTNPQNCEACHGEALTGGPSGVLCGSCHHSGWTGTHGEAYAENPDNCKTCHGEDLNGGLSGASCAGCHHGWSGSHGQAFQENPDSCQACHGDSGASCVDCHHSGWTGTHGQAYAENPNNCKGCHGEDLKGGLSGKSCLSCHHPTDNWNLTHGPKFAETPSRCEACHGADLTGGLSGKSCLSCHHHDNWDGTNHGDEFATTSDTCKACHGADLTGGLSGKSCVDCHDDNLHHDGEVNSSCNTCHVSIPGPNIANCEDCHPGCKPGSHLTHITVNSKGPATVLVCADCHDTNNYPLFGAADAAEALADTNVCDNCHSGNGAYNGVDNQDDSVGAKDNWAEGVYDGAALKANKEKWCVGCHDDVPGNSQQDGNGVSAPNIAGDEDTLTYGFYVSGHGRPSANKECLDCHDSTVSHIDGDPRTYAVSGNYRAGYRLNDDMAIPRDGEVHPAAFKLCTNCHVYLDLVDTDSILTNFRGVDTAPVNPVTQQHHYYHLEGWTTLVDWDSDYDGTVDSAISCTACHNVHGAPMDNGLGGLWANPVMIRHGELIGHVPAFDFWWKDGVGGFTHTLDDSRESSLVCGNFFVGGPDELAVNHVCFGCHASGRITYNRTPWHLLP